MEVRCGSCSKLFRVSDDKITGSGIKFVCTRCGEYVKITKEDFEHYTLSQTAVSALDLFEPKPKTAKPLYQTTAAGVEAAAANGLEDSLNFDLPTPPGHGASLDEPAAAFSEPATLEASASSTETASEPSLSEFASIADDKLAAVSEPVPSVQSEPVVVPVPEPQKEVLFVTASGPTVAPTVEPELEPEPKPEPIPEDLPQKAEITAKREPKAEPVPSSVSAAPRSVPATQPKAPKQEVKRAAQPIASGEQAAKVVLATPSAASSSGRLFLYAAGALLVLGLAGYGVFTYFQTGTQKERAAEPAMVSIEGLHIVNPAGAPEATGDLLITGVVENSLDVEKPAWYVVIDVYNAQGAVLDKIRLLNGKQIYTKRDYDILAGRGVNVQELKVKSRQDQGAVIPPKGSVNFAVRYLQPPAGVASFNPTLHSFDPVRLHKEIDLENSK